MAIELSTPSFKPREYEGEKIEYLVYGLDDEGNEIECIDGPVDSPDSAAELAGDILKQFPSLYFHVTAVLSDANGKMKDSEVVWSNFPEDESKKAEEIEYEKEHKNSRGEGAPWVIRDHKGGKIVASFAKKADAEAHLERMKHYSKDEVADSAGFSRFVKNLLDAAIDMFDDATWNRLVKDYDFGDDFEKGRSVADSLKNMQGWVLATEKRHTDEKLFNKDELESMAMNDYKSAVKAAWSAAGIKNFKIDHSDGSNKVLNVWPKTLDGNFYDVYWRIMPALGVVIQYSTEVGGDKNIEREIPFKDADDIETIFTDEFKELDSVIEGGRPTKTETAPDDYARDNFLKGALDYAEIEDDKGNVVLLKITKRYANEIGGDFCLRSYDGETDKSLAMGGIRYVVDRYGELLDMDPADAILEIAKE